MIIFQNDSVTGNASNKLVTLDEVFPYLGIESSTSTTAFVDFAIQCISDTYDNYVGYCLSQNSYVGYYDVSNDLKLYPDNIPIQSISAINYRFFPLSDWITIDSKYYVAYADYIFFWNYYPYTFSFWNPKSLKITYSAGFPTIPYDLKKICIEDVVNMIQESGFNEENIRLGKNLLGVKSKNANQETYSFGELDIKHQNILNKYKKYI